MARSEDLRTPECVIAFAQDLFKPKEKIGKKGTTYQYGCSLLFKKGTDLSALHKLALDAAQEEWGDKAAQWIKDEVIKSPFLDGDGKQAVSKKTGERHAGFTNHWFIRCVSGEKFKPKLYDTNRNLVLDPAGAPSGSRGYAVVNAFTWDTDEQGKGISFGISLVLITKKAEGDEILGGGGGPDPDKFFEKLYDEGEAPTSTKNGAGAAGLFG